MYFDEGKRLNTQQCRSSERNSRVKPATQPTPEWKTEIALDAANNKLQELMQLFYLLGRDPAIPKEARFHVTVAQSEIALLSRQMQNSTEAITEMRDSSAQPDCRKASNP
jgi:hypothetical protein